jgi:hypothetical protein
MEGVAMKFLLPKLSLYVFVFLLSACGGGSDGGGTVSPQPPANVAPIVDAGSDQTVNEQTAVTFSGSGTDPDGSISTYSWTQISGDTQTLTDAATATPSFESPVTTVQLTLTFQLTVTDNGGATASDTVDVTVEPVNALPTAIAGADKTVPEGSFVNLLGDGTDTDGSIASSTWTQVSGTTVSINSPAQLDTGVTISSGLDGETLTFSLEVTDNEGGAATDEISITVEPALTFVDYMGDIDPDPLTNVTINVTDVGTSSLVPATMATYGYNTIVVNPTDTFNFSIAADSLTLTGMGAPPIAVGDVIVGVIADESAGYAREITAINGDVYTTVPATLNQTFPDGEVNLDISLFNDILTATSFVKTSDGMVEQKSSSVDILNFNRTLQYEIEPGVKVVADLAMKSAFNVNVGFKVLSLTIKELSAIVSANYSTAAYLDVNLTKKYNKSIKKEFKPILDKTKLIWIGATPPIPVLVNIKAVPVIGGGIVMGAAATLKYGFKVGGAIRSGFEYADGILNNIAEFKPSMNKIGPNYELVGGVKMTAKASVGVIVTLYDINNEFPSLGDGKYGFSGPGIGVDLGPYAKFVAASKYVSTDTPPLTCLLDLSVGISSDLTIDYGTLGSQLNIKNPKNITLYDQNESLWNHKECDLDFGERGTTDTGILTGTLTDSAGEPIEGIVIQIKNAAGEVIAETISASDGTYQINEIINGSYDVFYSKQGFEEAQASIVVAEGETVSIPLTIVAVTPGVTEGTLRLSVVNDIAPTTLLPNIRILIRKNLNSPTGAIENFDYSTVTPLDIPLNSGYYTIEVVPQKVGNEAIFESIAIEGGAINDTTIVLPAEKTVFGFYTACLTEVDYCWGLSIMEDIPDDGIAIVTWAAHQNFQNIEVYMNDLDTSVSISGGPTILHRTNQPCDDGSIQDIDVVWTSVFSIGLTAGDTGYLAEFYDFGGCVANTSQTVDMYMK